MKKVAFVLLLLSYHGYMSANDGVDHCLSFAIIALANTKLVQHEVRVYNGMNISPQTLENRWHELDESSPELEAILSNPVSTEIVNVIESLSAHGEGFLIGRNGGLIAATNKTTDYYQGDEPQFVETMKLPKGQVWVQRSIADKSAGTMLTKIATPVFTSSGPEPRGVLVIGLDQFVLDFSGACSE